MTKAANQIKTIEKAIHLTSLFDHWDLVKVFTLKNPSEYWLTSSLALRNEESFLR